jgi:hypothetical protein
MELMPNLTPTVWERGRLDARRGPPRVLFGRMYEDSQIELDAFPAGARVFCIASAGCTAMRLASKCRVVAVDINPVQLTYARQRAAGALPIRGTVERAMALVRGLAPLAGWTYARVHRFLELDDPAEQIDCWRRHLDTRRFRVTFDALLSIGSLRAVYAPQLLAFLPRRLGAVMRGRMERCFGRHPNRTNPYARALLLGEPPGGPPPQSIKEIQFVCDDAAAYLEQQPRGSVDGFTLSNILDGVEPGYSQRLLTTVRHAAAPGATAVLRSFAEPRSTTAANRAAEDRAMIWGIVNVCPAGDLRDPLAPPNPVAHSVTPRSTRVWCG